MELQVLNQKIDEWAIKNELDQLDYDLQTLKIIEEIGELARAMLKNDVEQQKDAIGDIYIAFRISTLQSKESFNGDRIYTGTHVYESSRLFQRLMFYLGKGFMNTSSFFEVLQHTAIHLELDFTECVEQAYNVVVGRELSIVDGVAVKQDKAEYVVLEIKENNYEECKTLKDVKEQISDLKVIIDGDYDGCIDYKEQIKVYKLIETISFTENVEATKEMNTSIGKWEHKKLEE